jgi:predicted dehydrogenase
MSASKPFRIAILGAGHWHLPCYLNPAIEDGHSITLQENDPARLAAIAAKYAPKNVVAESAPEKVLSAKPDYAVLLGRPAETEAFIGLCLESGTPFMAEKPGSLSPGRLRALAARCHEKKLFGAAPFSLRWNILCRKVGDILASGAAGKVAALSMSYLAGPASRYVKWGCPWALDPKESGGGPMLNVGIHLPDLLRFWGFSPERLFSVSSRNINSGAADDFSSLTMRLGGGAHAVIESGYLVQNPFGGLCFSIYAEKVNIDYRNSSMKISWADGKTDTFQDQDPDPRPAMQRELISLLRNGGQPPADLSDMAAALSLCSGV